MAFTLSFRGIDPDLTLDSLTAWLNEHGETFDREDSDLLTLRTLPVTLQLDDRLRAHLDIASTTPLWRLVRVMFDLSIYLGADVRLLGTGEVTRAVLWSVLANEQDRQRIVNALHAAANTRHADEVFRGIWALLGTLGDGRDLRWDASKGAVVEVAEVGARGGITQADAVWIDNEATTGDEVSVPVDGHFHTLLWRWLSDAFPGIATP